MLVYFFDGVVHREFIPDGRGMNTPGASTMKTQQPTLHVV